MNSIWSGARNVKLLMVVAIVLAGSVLFAGWGDVSKFTAGILNSFYGSSPEKISLVGAPAAFDKVAEANGMRLLREDEYSISRFKGGGNESLKSRKLALVQDGVNRTIDLADNELVDIQLPGPNSVTFVGNGIETHSVYDTDRPEEAVSLYIKKKGGVAPVIVSMSLPFNNFYEKGQTPNKIDSKKKIFSETKNKIIAKFAGTKGRAKQDLPIISAFSADVDSAALDKLLSDPSVKKVELDRQLKISLDTSLDDIYAKDVWQLTDPNNNQLTGRGTRIAIVDTGVDYTHPDLGGCLGVNCKVISGYDFVNKDGDPMDDNGHGTHVAATAAGKGLLNGVAPDAKIIAYKVCDSAGSCWSSNSIAAINAATDPNGDGNTSDHADVGSMSLGGYGNPDDSTSLAVDKSSAAGVVWTIAAGNSGGASTIGSPGTARSAITVAAACKTAQIGTGGTCAYPIASFSSRGPLIWNGEDIKKPDVAAPGVSICAARWSNAFTTTCFDSSHVRISGTSMATPHVAGAAALVRQANPNYSPEQVKQLLKTTARDLGGGMIYNDEGAGEINLKAAIPFSPKIKASPSYWQATTDPTKKLSVNQQSFTVTPTETMASATLSMSSAIPGATFSFSKNALSFSGGSDTFQLEITVDNDTVKYGNYPISIFINSGGVVKGAIPLTLNILSTFSVTPTIADFGLDDPTLQSWTSAPLQFTIKNLRADVTQNIKISGFWPAGVTLTSGSPLTVPAGGQLVTDTRLNVDNTKFANGNYAGSVIFNNSIADYAVQAKFTKFFALVVSTPENAIYTELHDRNTLNYKINVRASSTVIYLNNPGTYDLITLFNLETVSGHRVWPRVYKEGIVVNSAITNVEVRKSEANHYIKFTTIDENGGIKVPTNSQISEVYIPSRSAYFHVYMIDSGDLSWDLLSDVSSNYLISLKKGIYQPELELYDWYKELTGISSDVNITNSPSDLTNVVIKQDLPSGSYKPILYSCFEIPRSNSCVVTYQYGKTFTTPFTQNLHTMKPPRLGTTDLLIYYRHITDIMRTTCTTAVACPSYFESPSFNVLTSGLEKWFGFATGYTERLPLAGLTLYQGRGPSFPSISILNSAVQLQTRPHYNDLSLKFPQPGYVLKQDLGFQEYDSLPYTIYQNGAALITGSLGGWFYNGTYSGSGITQSLTAGPYVLEIKVPYLIKGTTYTGLARASFNTSLSDPNPPALNQLGFYSKGMRSEFYDNSGENKVDAEFDPMGGSMSSVKIEYSSDGTNFTLATSTQNGAVYTAAIPDLGAINVLTLRVTGIDNSSNSFVYTFQVPAGTQDGSGTTPTPDTQAPTVSLTSPKAGTTVSSTVAIQANYSDNVGVAKLSLFVDGSENVYSSNPPFNLIWDSTKSADGSHNLQLKAYDAAGNIGTSTVVSVSVKNAPVPDTQAPIVSITSPIGGATVSGSINVQTAYSDNVGVVKIRFLLDGVLLGESLTQPFSFTWNTSNTSNGQHVLSAEALDVAGNKGVSANVSVNVQNTSAGDDTISPKISISSPQDGATVSKTVKIYVTANDEASGIRKIEIQIDGVIEKICLGPTTGTDPLVCQSSWQTRQISSGQHIITAIATDNSTNRNSTATYVSGTK